MLWHLCALQCICNVSTLLFFVYVSVVSAFVHWYVHHLCALLLCSMLPLCSAVFVWICCIVSVAMLYEGNDQCAVYMQVCYVVSVLCYMLGYLCAVSSFNVLFHCCSVLYCVSAMIEEWEIRS